MTTKKVTYKYSPSDSRIREITVDAMDCDFTIQQYLEYTDHEMKSAWTYGIIEVVAISGFKYLLLEDIKDFEDDDISTLAHLINMCPYYERFISDLVTSSEVYFNLEEMWEICKIAKKNKLMEKKDV